MLQLDLGGRDSSETALHSKVKQLEEELQAAKTTVEEAQKQQKDSEQHTANLQQWPNFRCAKWRLIMLLQDVARHTEVTPK